MRNSISINRNLIVVSVIFSLFAAIIWLINSPFLFQINKIDLVIAIDLLVVIPLIYYVLIRKTKIPKTTVIPVIIIGFVIGTYMLPEKQQNYLSLFKTWVLPFVELAAIGIVIFKVRSARKKYNQLKTVNEDLFTTLKNTCSELFPQKIAMPFATEIGVFYYAFINWKKKELKPHEYTYHKDSGSIALMVALIFIIAVETGTVHLLLAKWNPITAWVLTILSIYSLIQFLGILKSMLKRPIAIANGKLHLRYGIAKETTINFNAIESIEISSKDIELNKETRKMAFLGGLESHNIILRLKKENTLTGLYGIQRTFKTLLLHVDKKTEFVDSLNAAIKNPELFNISDVQVDETIISKGSLLSDKQKTIRATIWILAISWVFGFTAFSLFNQDNELAFGISTLIFSILPALIAIVLNKNEGGSWKDLQFIKPKLKHSIWAFISPFLYFGVVLSIQYGLEIRSLPNWTKLGSINELVLSLILGYPVMLFMLLGEEIAWRGYLQEKLIKTFGGWKGLVILGIIWGIWHLPLSLQGHNLPDNPLFETLVSTPLMCIALALMIGYYGLNSKSIFIGLLLHTSNNHFGGTFLYLTDTYNEFTHAMIFCIIYLLIIIIYSALLLKNEKRSTISEHSS